MAGGFAVANPRPVDLGSGLSQAGDNLVRVASLLEQRRRSEEEDRTRAILGASQSDIGVYAPEVIEQLQSATNPEDRNRILANSGQIAAVRKQQHMDLLRQAAAIQQATATPGQDPSGLIAAHQGALTSSQLPPNLIASVQSDLGTQSISGQAERGRVTEGRVYQEGQQADDRAYSERRDASNFARGEAAQLASEERQTKRQLEAEARAVERDDLEARRKYSVAAGVPWNNKNPPTWGEVNSGVFHALENEGKPQPKEVRAANRNISQLVQFENKKTSRSGDVTDQSVMGRARDLNTEAASTGSDLVVIPVVTSESGITNWSEDVRLEAMPWQQARVELARVYSIAEQQGPDSEAGKYIGHIVSLASTTDSPALKAMLSSQVSGPAKKALEATVNAKSSSTAPKPPPPGGKNVQLRPAPGEKTGQVVTRNAPLPNRLGPGQSAKKGKGAKPYRPGETTR